MLKLEPIEFFLRGIPEGFLIMLAIFVFSKTEIDKKNYIITSLIGSCIFFFVRKLPINYGVHTVISAGLIITLAVVKNKVDIIKAIRATLIYMLSLFIAEGINIIIIEQILKQDLETALGDPISKSIYGIPSLIIVLIVILIYYKVNIKNKRHISV
ncbi:MAG: hypothetical protein ACRC68_15270 [Clostridium sp.]